MIALSSADPLTMPSSCSTQLSVLHTFAPAARAAAARCYLVYRQLHARVGGVDAERQHVPAQVVTKIQRGKGAPLHAERAHTVRPLHQRAAQRAHDLHVRVVAQELAVPAGRYKNTLRKWSATVSLDVQRLPPRTARLHRRLCLRSCTFAHAITQICGCRCWGGGVVNVGEEGRT